MADASKTMDILLRLRTEVDQALKDLKDGKKAVDDIGSSAEKSSGMFGGLTDTFRQLVGAFGIGLGIQQVVSFFKETISGASDAEAATAKLGAEVKLAGADYETIKPAITAVKDELAQYGVRGVQVDQSIASLIARNFSLGQSLQAVTVAAKISVSEHISLEEALNDVINATNGVLRPGSLLGQLLINQRTQIIGAADQFERFNLIVANLGKLNEVAASQLDTSANQVKKFSASWKDFEEESGKIIEAVTGISGKLGGAAELLKQYNDELERTQRIAAGKATPNDQFDQANADLALLLKKRQQLEASFWDRINPFSSVQNTSTTEDADIWKLLGLGSFDQLTSAALDKGIADLRAKLTAAGKQIVTENTTAKTAVASQGDNQEDEQFNQRRDATDAFLQQQAAKEEASRTQLAEIIDQQDAAIRQKRFQAELSGLGDNLQQRLALIQTFYAQELTLDGAATQKQIDARNAIIDSAVQRIAKLDPTADVEYIKEVAAAAAVGKADITDFMGQLAIPQKNQAAFLQEFDLIVAQFGKVHEAASKLEGLQIEIPVKVKTDTDAAIKAAVTDIQDRLNKQVQDIQAQKNTGDVSAQGALTLTLQARAAASTSFQPVLAAEQSQLNNLNAVVGPLSPEQAAARQQLIKDITDHNAQMAKLKPTTEEEIQASNSLFEGMSLGAKKAAADSQSFGQIGASVTNDFEQGIAKGGTSLFDNLTSGAKNFGAAAQQAFSQLLKQIADAIVQSLILKAVQTGLGGFGGGGIVGGGGGATAAGSSGGGSYGDVVANGDADGAVLDYASGGHVGFRTSPGIITRGTTPRADDVPFWGSRGEGIVNAASVNHYGPSLIHALNRQSLPRDIFNRPAMPSHRFADGGIVGQLAREGGIYMGADRSSGRMTVVVPIGDTEIDKINSHSSSREATLAHIESNPQRVAEALRGRIRD